MESFFDFTITPFYYIGMAVWKIMLILIGVTAGETPQAFSEGTWNYITQSLYPLFLAIGSTLLNVFFLIGYLRSVSNLRDGMTLEMFIELCIKVALGNLVIQSIIPIMEQIFDLAGGISKLLIAGTDNPFVQSDMDGGAIFFYAVFGIIYFAVCLVSSVTIFLTVYGRYLQLYLLVLSAPIALSTIPGGPGISQTAGAWFKTLLAKSFSIVLIIIIRKHIIYKSLVKCQLSSIICNLKHIINIRFDPFIPDSLCPLCKRCYHILLKITRF